MSVLPVDAIRARFPSLSRVHNGFPVAYLDGPGGTQVPASVNPAASSTTARGFPPSGSAENTLT